MVKEPSSSAFPKNGWQFLSYFPKKVDILPKLVVTFLKRLTFYVTKCVNFFQDKTGLEEGTHYAYNIDVKDTANKIIKSHTGEFTTESMTAVENTYSTLSEANTQKLLRNGHLYILQDGKIYNAMGQEM